MLDAIGGWLADLRRPLLSDEPDLLREFMQYVPPSCTATQHIHLVPLPER